MKIVIIGSNEVYAMEHFFVKHLKSYPDVEIELLAVNEWIKQNLNFMLKLERRISSSVNTLYSKLNIFIEGKIDDLNPDIILIFKGMELYPTTLRRFKNKGIILANFNPDHPFIITSRGSGNKNVQKSITLYDIHFCYSYDVLEQIKTTYSINTVYLPFGFEEPVDWKFNLPIKEKMGVCFIGTADSIRAKAIKRLLASDISVDVYGSSWSEYLQEGSHDKLKVGAPVYGDDFWKIATEYRVQLNIFRPHNQGSHNMRTFEMPAAGAIMLAPESKEHTLFFESGKEAFFYANDEELITQTKRLLNLSQEEANLIRQRARQRSIQSGYTYKSRVDIVYQSLKKISL